MTRVSEDRDVTKSGRDIVELIDQLDHPDAVRQQKVRDELVEAGASAVETLANNLRLVNPRVRRGLVQVLGQIGDDAALLPLMRFVFDSRGDHREKNARGLGMQAIMRIAGPRHASRLFEFLVDMKDDPDPFVRAYVVEAFGKLGLDEGIEHVRAALDDDSDFVRERAQATLDELLEPPEPDQADMTGDALLAQIREASGAHLTHLVRLLTERDDAFALASKLVGEDGNRTMIGLQVLQSLDDPGARDVAVRHFQLTRSEADRAATLRLLAEHLRADARPSEVRVIKRGLKSGDKFIEFAALTGAARSGHPELTSQAAQAIRSGDYVVAASVSEALSRVADLLDFDLTDELFESLRMVRGHRRHTENDDLVRTEAYLLRCLAKMLEPSDSKVARRAELAALTSLRDSSNLQPIVVTSLELLDALVPARGYAMEQRWHPADAAALVALLDHANPGVQRRALEVIRRAAPGDTPHLSSTFERLIREGDAELVSQYVIPGIYATEGPNARRQLSDLSESAEPTVRRAAESALKRLQSRQPHIDVEYRRAED